MKKVLFPRGKKTMLYLVPLVHYFYLLLPRISVITWFLSFPAYFHCFFPLYMVYWVNFFSYWVQIHMQWRELILLTPFSLFFCLLERSLYTYFNSFIVCVLTSLSAWFWYTLKLENHCLAVHTCGLTKKLTIVVINWELQVIVFRGPLMYTYTDIESMVGWVVL